MYKLIALDMDDTLMTSSNVMSDRTREALMAAQNQGVKVMLASGRPTSGMVKDAKILELDQRESYIMSYNGARLTAMKDMSIKKERSLSKDQFDQVYDYCQENNIFIITYVDEEIVYEGSHAYMNREHELTGLPMKKVDNLKDYVQGFVPKAMAVDFEDKISQADRDLDGRLNDDIHATTSKPYFLEFIAKGVSKGVILKELAEELDIQREEIIAFGDSDNDKNMIEFAGLGVAMGNANDTIKSVADIVTADNDHDGIADIIEQYVLTK
ncbi:HAD family phosphatase [Macrococcus hajekii]|uniref:HAD family phosphatase n=1 Tax=Macrococcus hajekii TaxID=198482 RepID=A0A4V3BEL5_9STAP|nr:Cof-type HAD-IIB family hydrolase [Macrococcus hajekii]TDM03105.1 HAD family phosphatase [Macrococcus hajekii]GGA95997.1 haloacid dehalogenase [Macrococcus hajekii]